MTKTKSLLAACAALALSLGLMAAPANAQPMMHHHGMIHHHMMRHHPMMMRHHMMHHHMMRHHM